MFSHPIALVFCTALAAQDPAAVAPAAVPTIAYEDLAMLVQNSRRSFRSMLRGKERSAKYRPPELAGRRGRVYLALRKRGVVLVEAQTDEMDVVDASFAAGVMLAHAASDKKLKLVSQGDELGLEFELLGKPEYLTMRSYNDGGTWTEELLHAFEPAVEGIGVELDGRRGWTRPTEVIARNYTPDLALMSAESEISIKASDKIRDGHRIRYFRFTSHHVWQSKARGLPVVLKRGEAYVSPDDVNESAIDAAIGRMGAYLRYRRNSNGEFSHEYVPSADRYTTGNSARVQMRALAALATYAKRRGDADARRAVEKSIDVFKPHLQAVYTGSNEIPLSQQKPSGLVMAPYGHGSHLELSARLLSALVTFGGSKYAEERDGLIGGLLASQTPDGEIAMAFSPLPGQEPVRSKPAEAGWALLALAEANGFRPDNRILAAMSRSCRFYSRQYREKAHPVAAATMARAFALHYEQTNDKQFSDIVFEIVDRFVGLQLTAQACPYGELVGGINARVVGVVGADSALYLPAIADGLAVARRVGDRARAEHYAAALRSGLRFLLQLEVSEAGTYYMRSPRDAKGGIRAAPWNSRIRVDHCGDALLALMQAQTRLFTAK